MRPRWFHFPGWALLILSCPVAGARGEASAPSIRANLAWQIALERVGFSPGVIDGSIGKKTELATREFQRVRGLPPTGRLDVPPGRSRSRPTMPSPRTRWADLAEVGPVPTD
jgi:hypothetical protein